jgi:hypothetical protein
MTMPDDRALLSAYLAGELDAADAAAFEARLGDDPALAARLEVLHDALVRLGDVDAVEPPAGYGERLRARLDAEAGDAATAAEDRAGSAVVDLAAERARRRAVPWAPLGAVAAGVATLAVIVSVVGLPTADDADLAGAPEEAPAALDAPEAEMFTPDDDTMTDAPFDVAQQRDDGAPAPAAEVFAPVVVDSEVALADEEAVRDRYADLPEAANLLGRGRAEAEDQAPPARFAVQRAEAFASGVHPAACLDVISTATDAPVVVARVESAVYDGEPALVYVAATVSSGATEVDRVEVWVVAPGTCATHLFLTVAS